MSIKTRNTFTTIASLFLAIVVVFSTTGFNINYHVCQGKVKSVAINTTAESCSDAGDHMVSCTNRTDSDSSAQDRFTKKPCCVDKSIVHEVSDELKTAEYMFSNVISELVIAEQIILKANTSENFIVPIVSNVESIPIITNAQVRNQCFLI